MRTRLCVLALFGLVGLGQSVRELGTCGRDCFYSDDCAVEYGDQSCRCSYFHCRLIPEGSCGGGCISDSQCSRWAGGDDRCVCGSLFECINRKEAESTKYQAFSKFMMSAKGSAYQQKIAKMLKLYKENQQTNAMRDT